jgi:hypothetical protein
MEFLFVFSEGSDLHFVLTVDTAFTFNLEFEFMNGFLEFHLILEEFLYFFETVTDHNFKLLFLDAQYLSLSGMLFGSAMF